jgi:hypothetical protein
MRGLCVSSVTGTGLYLIIFSGGSAQHQGCPASFSPVARTFGVNRQQEADPVSGNAVCKEAFVLGRPGNDLLSRVLRHSTIGAEEFNGRVRDGIGFLAPRSNHRTGEGQRQGRLRPPPGTCHSSQVKQSFSSITIKPQQRT